MASLVQPTPVQPPNVVRQQLAPQAAPISASMPLPSAQTADPIALLEQKISELEVWAGGASKLIQAVHPALSAYLVPIAQAGRAMQEEISSMREQAAGSVEPPPGAVAPGGNPPPTGL